MKVKGSKRITVLFMLAILFAAMLVPGCIGTKAREEIARKSLSEGESYKIPDSDYSFEVEELNQGGCGSAISAKLNVSYKGQPIEEKYVHSCHSCSCGEECRGASNDEIGNGKFEVAIFEICSRSAEFIIFKNLG